MILRLLHVDTVHVSCCHCESRISLQVMVVVVVKGDLSGLVSRIDDVRGTYLDSIAFTS